MGQVYQTLISGYGQERVYVCVPKTISEWGQKRVCLNCSSVPNMVQNVDKTDRMLGQLNEQKTERELTAREKKH